MEDGGWRDVDEAQPSVGLRALCLLVKRLPFLRGLILSGLVALLAGCGSNVAPIPQTPAAAVHSPADARALLLACLDAHGGAAAYARLHDVNVRFDSHWAAVGPKLQPKLSDTGFREGSEERYLMTGGHGGWIVGQDHHGPKGEKFVARYPGGAAVWYNGQPSGDPEVKQAASLVTDAYSMFLFGPEFFVRHAAALQRLPEAGDVDGSACDKLLAVLQPGFGLSKEDRVVLYVDRQTRLLRRVSFTLNALESTQGAEVHVDLMEQRKLAGVMFPTRFYEHIDRPVNLDAHRWQLLGFDVNRGYSAAEVAGPKFLGKAATQAKGTAARP